MLRIGSFLYYSGMKGYYSGMKGYYSGMKGYYSGMKGVAPIMPRVEDQACHEKRVPA